MGNQRKEFITWEIEKEKGQPLGLCCVGERKGVIIKSLSGVSKEWGIFQSGDRVVSANGVEVMRKEELREILGKIDGKLTLIVERIVEKEPMFLGKSTMEESDAEGGDKEKPQRVIQLKTEWRNNEPLGFDVAEDLRISSVERRCVFHGRIRRGDLLYSVGGRKIQTVNEFHTAIFTSFPVLKIGILDELSEGSEDTEESTEPQVPHIPGSWSTTLDITDEQQAENEYYETDMSEESSSAEGTTTATDTSTTETAEETETTTESEETEATTESEETEASTESEETETTTESEETEATTESEETETTTESEETEATTESEETTEERTLLLAMQYEAGDILGVKINEDLVVTQVQSGTVADGKLQQGDVILELNSRKVRERNGFYNLLKYVSGLLELRISRNDAGVKSLQLPDNLEELIRRREGYEYLAVTVNLPQDQSTPFSCAHLAFRLRNQRNSVIVSKTFQQGIGVHSLKKFDRICAINGILLSDRKVARQIIGQSSRHFQVVVERPIAHHIIQDMLKDEQERYSLQIQRRNQASHGELPADVQEIVDEELARRRSGTTTAAPPAIINTPSSGRRSIQLNVEHIETPIVSDVDPQKNLKKVARNDA